MDAEASRQLAAARLSVDEIVPGQLFVSGKRGAADLAALHQRGITHIVNCSSLLKEGELENYHDDTLGYYRLSLEDMPQCPLLSLLPAGATRGTGPEGMAASAAFRIDMFSLLISLLFCR